MELKLSFLALTILSNIFLIFIGFKAISKTSDAQIRDKAKLIIGLLLWQIFIYLIASTGILKSYEKPPLFAILFIMPSFIFTGIFLFRNRNKQWIKSIPEHWIVYFQSYRILVEILFIFSLAQGIYNEQVTIEGYNFDMLFAITAPVMAFLVYQKKVLSARVILFWNYLGLLVLASVIILFLASIYTPRIFGSDKSLLPLEAMTYPFVLIPAFLMPTAVYLHFLSIIQVKNRLDKE
jgi:hypothetical protein